jgi:hypothetical protein
MRATHFRIPIAISKVHFQFEGIFSFKKKLTLRRCMRGKYVHSYVFDYLQQFWDNYAGMPRFALAMFNEGHEGTGEVIGLVDDDLHEFLSSEYESGGFDNTAVFFLSDHGLHMGPFYMFGVTRYDQIKLIVDLLCKARKSPTFVQCSFSTEILRRESWS